MSRRTNPALVGAFVVGAILLGLAGVMLLGSKDLFRETYPFVAYFPYSVNGLRAGAPVKFKGVELGSVDEIRLPLTSGGDDPPVAVFFSLDAEKLRSAQEDEPEPEELAGAIEAGLRVRLEQESFVTGLLFLSIAFVPDSDVTLHEPIEGILEIPTAPTEFEELAEQIKRFVERLEHVDLGALVHDLQSMVQSVEQLLRSAPFQDALASLDHMLVSVGGAAEVVKQEIGPLVASLDAAAQRVEAVGADFQNRVAETSQTLDAIEGLASSVERSVQELTRSVEATLLAARAVIDPASPPLARLEHALAELSATARAARAVLEILERDPAALVRGKGEPEEPR
jgi:paraquat-inducible protein B